MSLRSLYSLAVRATLVSIFCACSGCGVAATPQPSASQTGPGSTLQPMQEIAPATSASHGNGIEPDEAATSSLRAAPTTSDVRQDQPEQPAAKRADIYDTNADSAADVSAAIERAKRENKRVLVMFGGNWCGWCYKLHDVFQKNREIATSLRNDYERVMVDIGRFDKNMELAASYGADLKAHGVPFVTILDADGQVLANQDTGELEDGPVHDIAKVHDFLARWAAEPQDAEQVLADAKARAKDQGKLLFVHLGAPWCGWCHRLEDFLNANGSLFERDYLLVKIDIDRMAHGKSVAEQLRGTEQGGIPWIAILDSSGNKLATSDGPSGNIGYPAEAQEIEHFIAMLQSTAKNMTPDQIGQVQTILGESAKKYLSR